MGEVYRARDTTLRREVAIKVLPEAFTTDPDRAACFHRPRADEVAEALLVRVHVEWSFVTGSKQIQFCLVSLVSLVVNQSRNEHPRSMMA